MDIFESMHSTAMAEYLESVKKVYRSYLGLLIALRIYSQLAHMWIYAGCVYTEILHWAESEMCAFKTMLF